MDRLIGPAVDRIGKGLRERAAYENARRVVRQARAATNGQAGLWYWFWQELPSYQGIAVSDEQRKKQDEAHAVERAGGAAGSTTSLRLGRDGDGWATFSILHEQRTVVSCATWWTVEGGHAAMGSALVEAYSGDFATPGLVSVRGSTRPPPWWLKTGTWLTEMEPPSGLNLFHRTEAALLAQAGRIVACAIIDGA